MTLEVGGETLFNASLSVIRNNQRLVLLMDPEAAALRFRLSWDALVKGFRWLQGEQGLADWDSPDEWSEEKGLASESMFLLLMQLSASDLAGKCRAGQSTRGLTIHSSVSYASGEEEPHLLVIVDADRQFRLFHCHGDQESHLETVEAGAAVESIRRAVEKLPEIN